MTVTCPGCGLAGDGDGPVHDYLIASPACFAAFNTVMALHYSSPAHWPAHHPLTDAWALQHSRGDDPRLRRSAALHLAALGLWAERGAAEADVIALKRRIAADRPELALPAVPASATIAAVSPDPDPAAHIAAAGSYARAVWADHADHHAAARGWWA